MDVPRINQATLLLCAAALCCNARAPAGEGPTATAEPLAQGTATSNEPALAGPGVTDGTAPRRALGKRYPPGRWRLANPVELLGSMLWPSHILVRHHEVAPRAIPFDTMQWSRGPTPPSRTREEAFELARELAERARTQPDRFAQLASSNSEDVATRERGGSLGGVDGSYFYLWPEVLDALAALTPGEVSEVVETEFGFHVFQLRTPPPEESVSGRRLVVAYDDAPWLHTFFPRWTVPTRTAAEAWSLASSLYERARGGHSFEQLLVQYSDHRDVIRGGDFGTWSTLEPTPIASIVELTRGLQEGEIAPPIDSALGVQIVQRTAPPPRKTLAMQVIQLRFDPAATFGPSSEREALAALRSMAAHLRSSPDEFDRYRREHCCADTYEWREGQGMASEEAVLARLDIGEIHLEPIKLGPTRYALVRRVAPRNAPPRTMKFTLPAPEKADLDFFFSEAQNWRWLEAWGAMASDALHLTGGVAEQFAELHTDLARFEAATSEEARSVIFKEVLQRVKSLVGAGYDDYIAFMERHVEARLLGPDAAAGALSISTGIR